jgi:sugar/nucleoside kinase (ribokinase family)
MNAEFDVLAIGNAIVDVIAQAEDSFLETEGIAKGSMRLIPAEEASALYAKMGPGREISGGSAANSMAGVAALGGRAAFIGRVSDDQLGQVFAHDIRAGGVDYRTPPALGGPPTGQCLILVSPDGQRTMNTYLGSCQEVDASDVDEARVRAAAVTYIEGYLWDPPAPIRACSKALDIAHAAGRKTAMTLSDVFCVNGHRADFLELIANRIDIVFANENEVRALFETNNVEAAIDGLARIAHIAVVTRSEKGAVVASGTERHAVPAQPVARVLDTTGAGDLFAAGFLAGFTRGRPLAECATIGTIAAGEVIEHFGARPEADLQERVVAVLGRG